MSTSIPPPTPAKPVSAAVKADMDDCIRALLVLSDGAERQFLQFVEQLELWLGERVAHKAEVERLQAELIKSQSEVTRLEKKLKNAQHMLGLEKEKRIVSEQQIKQIFHMMDKLKISSAKSSGEDTPERLLSLLSSTLEYGGQVLGAPGHSECYRSSHGGNEVVGLSPKPPLSTIDESGDTLDAVSDIDLTEGDDLECSDVMVQSSHSPDGHRYGRRSSSRKRPSRASSPTLATEHDTSRRKAARLSRDQSISGAVDCGRPPLHPSSQASYPPTAPPLPQPDDWLLGRTPQNGTRRQAPMPPTPQVSTPHAVYSTPPQNSPLQRNHLSASRMQTRPHCFYNKTVYMTEHCQPCSKRIKFGKGALKCRDCRAVCHQECRDAVPLPCVPTVSTPGNKHYIGTISDFTPALSPMVPALVVHCTMEVEQRGAVEVGVYRVSALERDVKELKEKFLRGKGVPSLQGVDIHVVCNCVKHFLRCLKEPLVTHSLWPRFVQAAGLREESDCEAALYQCVTELPQPNRDTLAWMMVHLQRMSEAKDCMMPTGNLSKVFGPTLVGYSVPDPEPQMLLMQTADQQTVMTKLFAISRDYWESFTRGGNDQLFGAPGTLPQLEADALTPDTGRAGISIGRSSRRRSIITHTPLK